ncbi:phosphate ABC transporter substrate-binding protein PstS [Achromobacter arsenitoxydans]|uniref:Phosphate-binding protein PstS n=1 Tax=Achromobacter arsenitoxydans SY8 TaxID=477184 RepID=H0F869_9BURK|nr:phosphate ABC transporter substrate-binding protein PstS [Achromobacter arsenitoxydans]EHK65502.1 ABC transporter phosphate-binding protein [Achromobacter arsenitoxydans SY8]
MFVQAKRYAAGLGIFIALGMGAAQAADITGAGSTFVYPILSKWSDTYNTKTGNKINYQSIGSGGGIAQIKAGTVDFGASDKPLPPKELDEAGLGQFPVVIGGVVPVINIAGVEPGKLRFTGPLLADIYLGKIQKWNDKAIADLNPEVKLPDAKITVVHRSDGSGTTFNWVNYLSKISPEWQSKVGEGTSVQWPVGVGGKGNEGVAAYVKQIKNSIGYVELAYALQNKMSYAAVKNSEGNFVAPSDKTFQSAAAHADWKNAQDFHLVITNAPGADAWPISATVFVMMYKQPKDAGRTAATLDFFKWALENGQHEAEALDYVPLPKELVAQIESYWAAQIKR